MFTVKEGYRGVVTQGSKLHHIAEPGFNFKLPFVQSVTEVDVRTQSANEQVLVGTNNQQSVSTKVTINYHLDENSVGTIYSKTGLSKINDVISTRIREDTAAVVAKYQAEDLLKLRGEVKNSLVVLLSRSLKPYNIILEDVQLTEFKFSAAYTQAIERKQIAEQDALTAINKTREVKEKAIQAVEAAKGEAEAIKIQAEAIRENGGQAYLDLQAVKQWDGKLPVTMMGSQSMPFVNVK